MATKKRRAATKQPSRLRVPVSSKRSLIKPERYGKAGLRFKIDEMLESHHGRPEQEWKALGREASEILYVIAAGEEDHPFRKRAIQVLGKIKDPGALAYLSRIVSDTEEDRIVKMVAARAIGDIGGPAAAGILSDAASDPDEPLRHKVVQALGAAGETRSIVTLTQIAEKDKSALVKEAAVDAIRRISLRHNLKFK